MGVALPVALVLGEAAERLGDVAGDARLLGQDQCLGHAASSPAGPRTPSPVSPRTGTGRPSLLAAVLGAGRQALAGPDGALADCRVASRPGRRLRTLPAPGGTMSDAQPITGLRPGQVAEHVFLCGDPARVAAHRERLERRPRGLPGAGVPGGHRAAWTGRRLTAASTGIGGPEHRGPAGGAGEARRAHLPAHRQQRRARPEPRARRPGRDDRRGARRRHQPELRGARVPGGRRPRAGRRAARRGARARRALPRGHHLVARRLLRAERRRHGRTAAWPR